MHYNCKISKTSPLWSKFIKETKPTNILKELEQIAKHLDRKQEVEFFTMH